MGSKSCNQAAGRDVSLQRWDRIALVVSLARAWEHHFKHGSPETLVLGKRGFAIEWALMKAVRELNEEFPKALPFNNPDIDVAKIIECAPK